MINWKDLKDPEFWKDKKKYFKIINNLLIRYFKWFVVLAVVLVLAVGSLFLIKPKYDQINSLLKSSQQKQQELLKQKRERLDKLQGVIESFEEIPSKQKDKIEEVLPEKKNKEKLFIKIKQLVEKNKLILKSISIQEGKKKEKNNREVTTRKSSQKDQDSKKEVQVIDRSVPEGVEKIEVQVFVFGTNYDSLKRLLNTLEKSLPIIDVTNVNFNPSSNTTNLTLETYRLK